MTRHVRRVGLCLLVLATLAVVCWLKIARQEDDNPPASALTASDRRPTLSAPGEALASRSRQEQPPGLVAHEESKSLAIWSKIVLN